MFPTPLKNQEATLVNAPKSLVLVIGAAVALMTSAAQAQTTATSVHVASVQTSIEQEYGHRDRVRVRATAEVVVVDDLDLGNPVQGAVVTVTFTGDLMRKGETVTGVTGADGSVTLTMSKWAAYLWDYSGHYFTCCVDNVSASLPYNPADDVVSCDTVWFL